MPEEVAVLSILISAWTPLGCWQKQPLHQNGQRGEGNCKSMKLVTQGVWAPTLIFSRMAGVSVCSLWKHRSLACDFGALHSTHLKSCSLFGMHRRYSESLAQQERSTTHKGEEMHLPSWIQNRVKTGVWLMLPWIMLPFSTLHVYLQGYSPHHMENRRSKMTVALLTQQDLHRKCNVKHPTASPEVKRWGPFSRGVT